MKLGSTRIIRKQCGKDVQPGRLELHYYNYYDAYGSNVYWRSNLSHCGLAEVYVGYDFQVLPVPS